MVLSCTTNHFRQAQRIKTKLQGIPVYEEKTGTTESVISVRVLTPAEIERVKAAFEDAAAENICEFEEAA